MTHIPAIFDAGIFDSGIFKVDNADLGIFDTGIFDNAEPFGIFDHLEQGTAVVTPTPVRGGGAGQFGEPAKLILSWLPPKKKKKKEEERVEIVEDAIEQALEAAPVAPPISPEQVELAARLLLAEYGLAELRRIRYAETLLLRIEQVMAEIDDEEVLLLAA